MPARLSSLLSGLISATNNRKSRWPRFLLFFTLITALALLLPLVQGHEITPWITWLTAVIISMVMLGLMTLISGAQDQEQELREKNRELEEIRETLEQRVNERTAEILYQKQFFEALVQNSPQGVVILDLNYRIVSCNPAFQLLFGYTQEEIIGQPLDPLITTPQLLHEAIQMTLNVRQGLTMQAAGQRCRKDGSLVDVEIFGVPVIMDGRQVGVLGMYLDVTTRRQAENALHHLATHDSLTGLPNRAFFSSHLSQSLENACSLNQRVTVLFLDLDGFKAVNDQYGHELGDRLLQAVSQRLQNSLPPKGLVARLGGDEFTFVIENLARPRDVAVLTERILNTLQEPFFVENHALRISASIGISISPEDGQDSETLLKNADAAMYRAKELGKNTYQFYTRYVSTGLSALQQGVP